MENLKARLVVFLFVHIWFFVFYIKYRLRKLLMYISNFRGNKLSEAQFLELLSKYTSFLGYAAVFPDKNYYSNLYTDKKFMAFSQRSKFVTTYFIFSIALGFVFSLFISYFN